MTRYRYHFSSRDFYFIDIEAESLEEAKEELDYVGLNYQNEDCSGFLMEQGRSHEDEDFRDDSDWEQIDEVNS
ncbi:hypothetical protein [Bacteroides sp.]|uniref:hypothetical protein n=1 Tax=Bacteroides sp. TaxID=29523 RepID=UPI002615509D|nr:hypothetical protein [Bacteroides sp.]MDD3039034.1 hypothetical protein [Bacteroides sp.]